MLRKAILFLVCLFCGCGGGQSHRAYPEETVRQYVRLAVALGERDPDSLDYYYGPPEWVADIHSNPPRLAGIKTSALALIGRIKSDTPQLEYLTRQLQAIAARVDLLMGVRSSFDEEARALFGFSMVLPENQKHLAEVRTELALLLPGSTPLADRYTAFDAKFLVSAERLPAVMSRALAGCRERTLEHLALPNGEGVKIEYVSNKPWNAYSYYHGNFQSLIQINQDFALTVDRALQLACHEGYPGHHVYSSIEDAQLVQREGRRELTVQPTFSPQSFASEAAATIAVNVAFPEDERLRFERDELFPLAGLNPSTADRYFRVERLVGELEITEPAIAREYLDGKLEFLRAASAMQDQALMEHSDATLKYINEFRTYMLTYTAGKVLAKNCIAGQDRWHIFEQLILLQKSLSDCAK